MTFYRLNGNLLLRIHFLEVIDVDFNSFSIDHVPVSIPWRVYQWRWKNFLKGLNHQETTNIFEIHHYEFEYKKFV